ncbi:MAG: pyrroloquinoline quinone precursor peptide PqqA [Pseudonocardia sp.]|nr:pyrroloquinoline quinone precursor peptide PqqA [Pseudonocardia sp.]
MESTQTHTEWEAPEFEEIACAPEVTMYVARSDT